MNCTVPPPPRTRATGDAGFVGGAEAMLFGVAIFTVGVLLMVNAWAVIDAKMASSSAARETARLYVESDGNVDAALEAGRTAFEATSNFDATDLDMAITGAFVRCGRITVVTTYRVPAITLPFGGGWGNGFEVTASHSELVDPYRSGLPGPADCG